jgi:hypothetical protein
MRDEAIQDFQTRSKAWGTIMSRIMPLTFLLAVSMAGLPASELRGG